MHSLFDEAAQYADDMRAHYKAKGLDAALMDKLADDWLEHFNADASASQFYPDGRLYFERRLEILRRPISFEAKQDLMKQLSAGPRRSYGIATGAIDPAFDDPSVSPAYFV